MNNYRARYPMMPGVFGLLAVITFLYACGGGGSSSSGGSGSDQGGNATASYTSHPNVSVNVHKQYYTVHGSGISTLRQDLQQKGPGGYYARVTTSISYSYKTKGNCEIDEINVNVKSNMLLPQWNPPASASAQTRSEWSRFISALVAHETNHVRIDVDEAEALASTLQNLPRHSNCGELDGSVKQAHSTAIDRATQRNRAYDSSTNHGKTEGAVL